MNRFVPATLALLAAWPAASQVASITGTVSGFIYDAPSRSVRPVGGVPGSSYLGQPVLTDLDAAFIAPDAQSAVIVTNGQIALVSGLNNPVSTPIPDLDPQSDIVSWGSKSRALVAYSSANRILRRLDISTGSPVAGPAIDLSVIEGDVAGLATNSDASQTVIAVKHPTQGGFFGLTDGGSPVRLSLTDPGPVIFSRHTNLFYAVDRSTSQILRFSQGISGPGDALSFSGESAPLADPVGLALSADEQRIYVAGGADRIVRAYDLPSATVAGDMSLETSPKSISALDPASTVLLLGPRTGADQPAWILDARTTPSIFFVPAAND